MKITLAHARDRLLPILLSQAIGLLCGIAGVRLVSHWVQPDILGRYGVFLTFTTLGHWFVYAGLLKFIARHWADAENKAGFLRACVRSWVQKLPWLLLLSSAAAWAGGQLGGLSVFATLGPLFIATALGSLGLMAEGTLQAGRRYWTDLGVSSVGSITRTFIPPVLFLTASAEIGLYLGFGLHSLCFALAAIVTVSRYWPAANAGAEKTRVVIPSIYDGKFFVILSAAIWALSGINRWIMAGFFGETHAGLFTLAGNLAQIVPAMLGAVFMQYFQPGLFAAPHATVSERRALARRIDLLAGAYTLIALGGIVALRLVAPWLIGPLIAENYRPALDYIVGAGCFGLAVISAQFFHVMLLAGKTERACAPVDISSAALLIAGGLLTAAFGGEDSFVWWLVITPVVPWLLTRPLARFYFSRPSGTDVGAPR